MKTADVVVSTFRPGSASQFGADYETLKADNPGLVYTHLTAFGPEGPLANLPAYEGVVAAKGGRMMAFEGTAPRTGPVFSALQVTHHAATQATVMGTVAALIDQDAVTHRRPPREQRDGRHEPDRGHRLGGDPQRRQGGGAPHPRRPGSIAVSCCTRGWRRWRRRPEQTNWRCAPT